MPEAALNTPATAAAPPVVLPLVADDGHRFAADVFEPRGPARGVLAFWPALGTRGRFYGRLGAALAAEGFVVAVADWRGAGSSDRRAGRGTRGNHGFAELLERDMPALVAALERRYPGWPLFVGGHSLGGQLAGLFAARDPARVAGAVLVASGTIAARAYPWKTRAGVALLARISRPIAALVGHFPGRRLGFGGRETAGVMADWSRVARTGRYAPLHARIDYEAALATATVPLLAISFPGDSWSPASTARAYLDKFRQAGAQAEHVVWTEANGTAPGFDHFSWARTPGAVARRLAAWMQVRATAKDPLHPSR